jgi:hypothetical protein
VIPRVVVPYVKLHPVTQQVLNGSNADVHYEMVGDDDGAYCQLLNNLWQRGSSVIIVEQDIVPWPGALDEIWQCPAQWCTYSYAWRNEYGRTGIGLSHMLGCVKLSAELMRALPNVWRESCSWVNCDRRLFFTARNHGIDPHLHRPAVTHLKG